jgi:uncharacterized membrane protein
MALSHLPDAGIPDVHRVCQIAFKAVLSCAQVILTGKANFSFAKNNLYAASIYTIMVGIIGSILADRSCLCAMQYNTLFNANPFG